MAAEGKIDKFESFHNTGSEGSLSNQCMLISILDHLRNTQPEIYSNMTVRDFRKINGITS
jgi:hypothetical protein